MRMYLMTDGEESLLKWYLHCHVNYISMVTYRQQLWRYHRVSYISTVTHGHDNGDTILNERQYAIYMHIIPNCAHKYVTPALD
jgi:hypothetical protein